MSVRKKAKSLWAKLEYWGITALLPISIFITIWTTVPLFGLNSTQLAEPVIPPAQQQALDDANGSDAGQALQKDGLTGKQVIEDKDQVQLLEDFITKAGLAATGPYVVFRTDQALAEKQKEAATVAPDRVLDNSNRVTVALRQEFTNERGILCAAGNIDGLKKAWQDINNHTNGMMLTSEPFKLNHKNLPKLPQSVGTVTCMLYVPS